MYLLPQRFCAKLKVCYLSFRWARLESKVSEDSFAYMPTQLCLTLCDPIAPGPLEFPGKNTGAGCHFLLHGIFLTQGLNLRLLQWQADSLPADPPGKPSITWCQRVGPLRGG